MEFGVVAGESFNFVLNNSVIKDNRIPPRGYTVAAYDRPGLRPVGVFFADGQYLDETAYPLPAGAGRGRRPPVVPDRIEGVR